MITITITRGLACALATNILLEDLRGQFKNGHVLSGPLAYWDSSCIH